MPEEENKSVTEVTQDAAAPAETEAQQTERQEKESESRKRNDLEYNWAEARRKMQELERQGQEQREELARLKQQTTPPPKEEDYGIEDEALAEGKHIKELKRELRQLKEYMKVKETATLDERLQMKFPDFSETVTKENVELLKQNEPELAESLRGLAHDPHAQAAAAYKMIKKFGIKVDSPNTPERKKAIENSQKPVSVQAATRGSAIGNAHMFEGGITPELKKQLWADMQQAMKGA